ncbi:MAG: ABC transporter permease [Xanthomonadales bacterium]|nr:hypothetical protein [Xanthomonadales bacterium]MCC6593449.1 ABC transporter permease [Xanthomonadales bacterium]MCE7929790.1 hypothetical protein [Xanthomonadales bacterium PRO6]
MFLLSECRLALRRLSRQPGYGLGLVATLALGIAVCAAMGGIVHGVLWKALDYPQSERVVVLRSGNAEGAGEAGPLNGAEADTLARVEGLEAAGYYLWHGATLLGGESPRMLTVFPVGGEFFRALAVPPLLGRTLTAADSGGEGRVVLSHELWQELYGGDPAAIGQTLRMDWISARIVGVMPRGFGYPIRGQHLWIAYDPTQLRADPVLYRNARFFHAIGRVREGVSSAALGDALARHSQVLAVEQGEALDGWRLQARPLLDETVGAVRPVLYALLAIALLALLVACANAVNLVALRGIARRHELGIHQALGASGGRLARGAFVETALLGIVASALGVGLAWLALRGFVGLADSELPRAEEVVLDWPVALVAAGFSLVCSLIAAALPAWRLRRHDPLDGLRLGPARSTGRLGAGGWLLPAIACAVSTGGLAAALLLLQYVQQLERIPLGFEPHGVYSMQLFRDFDQQPGEYTRTLMERMRTLPGVAAVATLSAQPLSGIGAIPVDVQVPGREQREALRPKVRTVAGPVQTVLRLELRRGRWLDAGDVDGAEPVALINQRFAELVFAGIDPIGQIVAIPPFGRSGERIRFRIVGVMADARMQRVVERAAPEIWLPDAQYWTSSVALLMRTELPPASLDAAARKAFWTLHPQTGLFGTGELLAEVEQQLAQPRFFARNAGAFALLTLALAAVGLHSVVAFGLARRRREFALRLALGSAPRALAGRVLGHGYRLALPATVAGGLIGWAFSRALEGALLGAQARPLDAIAFASLLLLLVVALACAHSVCVAMRVQAMTALRQE